MEYDRNRIHSYEFNNVYKAIRRKIREAFIAEKGNVLISADYSQIELRIMAHLSGDKNLTHAFNNNIDVHSATASEIFNISLEEVATDHRRSAKPLILA